MNLEKIIAENMLRFGTKNISESQFRKVVRLTELKDPATEQPAFERDKGKPTSTWVAKIICTYMGYGNVKCNITGYCESKDGKTGWQPARIMVQYSQLGNNNISQITYEYNPTDGTYPLRTGDTEPKWEDIKYSGPGNYPINAVGAVITAINTKCNKSSKAGDALLKLGNMTNEYYKVGAEVAGKFPCADKWTKRQKSDPETDAAIGLPVLRCGTTYITCDDANGTITKNSKPSYTYAGAGASFGNSIHTMVNALCLTSTPIEVSGFAKLTGQDKSAMEADVITELNRIAAASTITAAAPVDKK